jgi:hypothetical protein
MRTDERIHALHFRIVAVFPQKRLGKRLGIRPEVLAISLVEHT